MTPEQQALIDSTTELVTAFNVLVTDNQAMLAADGAYDAIAAQRAGHLADFQAANEAWSAHPADTGLLSAVLAAIGTLTQDMQEQAAKRTVKDDADATQAAALASYTTVRSDTTGKFESFLAATEFQS